MNLSQLASNINRLADEEVNTSAIQEYINDCIARINADFKSIYPYFSSSNPTDFNHPLSVTYQRLLFIPFACARVKSQEGDLQSAQIFFNEFLDNYTTFTAKYKIPDEYLDESEPQTIEFDYGSRNWEW